MKTIKAVKIKIPAKLIISGEHSVIYNNTAITSAINLFMKIKIKKLSEKKPQIIIINNKNYIKHSVFLIKNGHLDIPNDCDLMNKSILNIISDFHKKTNTKLCALKLIINSKIPINYGLGSSASLVSGIVFGLNKLLNSNINSNTLMKITIEAENIFHGKSSGIDVQTVVNGGIMTFANNNVNKINFNDKDSGNKKSNFLKKILIIYTGRPSFLTKDVVNNVAKNIDSFPFKKNWDDSRDITNKIIKYYKLNNCKEFCRQIAYNQHLLETIGVVTDEVKDFIENLKQQQIYAKICGAGTIALKEKLPNNGVIAIFHPISKFQMKIVKRMCKIKHFNLKKVKIAKNGITISASWLQ